jgi:hypothetical protein
MSAAVLGVTNTIFTKATVGEDGALHLDGPAPAFTPGSRVLLTIAPIAEVTGEDSKPLVGTVTLFDDPFGPAAPPEDWDALRSC